MKTEVWKDIPGYDCLYEVSDHGRIKQKDQFVVLEGGTLYCIRQGRFLTIRETKRGYQQVWLYSQGKGHGKPKSGYQVHRLVMLAFEPNPEHKVLQVNHRDGVKSNNFLQNLEWVTNLENMRHSFSTGLRKGQGQGAKNPMSKLTEQDVLEIVEMLKDGHTQQNIASNFSVGRSAIANIASGLTWKHITENLIN